jgi:glucose-6-phosphate 1-dehydrogenase
MMEPSAKPQPAAIVIFGASGDLTQRKVVPALFNLFLDGLLPEKFSVIGVARKPMSDDEFRKRLREGVDKFSRRGRAADADWQKFAANFHYRAAAYDDAGAYGSLAEQLTQLDKSWDASATRIFYLATPPSVFETVAGQLGRAGLYKERQRARIVVEKPFGRDLASARSLNKSLGRIFSEPQIYRIDHYLGKETVQNILAFRFANAIFEPIWNRRYIDNVQITVAESIGIENRAHFYERTGALRDMVQNHLLQILCLTAMEPPVAFNADEIRNKTVDVLRAIRPIPREKVREFAVRGQYGEGKIGEKIAPAYRAARDVAPDSATETFAALKLFIDNWRWQGVPFYLRTGKRLAQTVSAVGIQFRPVPHQAISYCSVGDWRQNCLMIHIQPEEDILLSFQAKQPGPIMCVSPVDMRFCYHEAFQTPTPEAYETLLLDVMEGDATLFMRADQVEAAWSVVTPVLESWESERPKDFPNYASGSWGPESADALLAKDNHTWLSPSIGLGAKKADLKS